MATADPVASSSPSLWSRIAPSPKGVDGGGGWAKSLFRRPQDNASQSRFVEMFDDNYQIGAPESVQTPSDTRPVTRKKKQKVKPKRQPSSGDSPPAPHDDNPSPDNASPTRPSIANGSGVRRRSSIARLISRDKPSPKPITFEDMAADPSARPVRRSLSLSRSQSENAVFGGSPLAPEADQKTQARARDASPLASGSSGSFDGNSPVDYAPESLIRAFAQSDASPRQVSASLEGNESKDDPQPGVPADTEQIPSQETSGDDQPEVNGDELQGTSGSANAEGDVLGPLDEVSNVGGEDVVYNPAPATIDEDKPIAQPGAEPTLRRGGSVKRSDSTRRRSFAPLGSTVGQLDLSGLPHKQGESQLSRRLSLSRTRSNVESRTLGLDDLVGADLTRKSSVKAGATQPRERDARRSSFAPLGSLAGPMDMPLLGRSGTAQEDGVGHRLSLSLSRTRSNAQAQPRTIGLEELSAEPALTRTRSIKIAPEADTGRRSSFAPLGSLAGGFELNQLGRRSSRSGGQGTGLFRTQSASEPRQAREISFADLSQEPAARTTKREDDDQRTRRTSFAPLGSNVGELDFRGLGKRPEQSVGVGLKELTEEPALKRRQSIKFAPDVSGRRKSFAPLGSAVGEFDFRGLGKGNQSRSADETRGEDMASAEKEAPLRPTMSTQSRRSSQDIVQLARQTSRGLGRRLSQVFGGSQAETQNVGLEEMSAPSGLQRAGSQSRKQESGDGRRRSIGGLGSLVQPLDFNQLDRNKNGLVKRLSLKRSRSKGKGSTRSDQVGASEEVTAATPVPDAHDEPVSDNEVYATPPDSGDASAEKAVPDLAIGQSFDAVEGRGPNDIDGNDEQDETQRTSPQETSDAPIQLSEPLASAATGTPLEDQAQPETLVAGEHIPEPVMDAQARQAVGLVTSKDTVAADGTEKMNEPGTSLLEGFLTYQTEKERSWRRTRYHLMPGELVFVDSEASSTDRVKHTLSTVEPVLTGYAGSQAEGSFSIPVVQGDSVEHYFVFCDSAAEREKLLQGLETAKSK